jgi:hypothetical protein
MSNLKTIFSYILSVEVPPERKQKKKAGNAALSLFSFSSGILYMLFFMLLSASVGFILRIPITKYHIIIAGILAMAALYIHVKNIKKDTIKIWLTTIVFILIISALSLKISGSYYDLSYDGQTYHQEAIIALSNGWNPFYEKLTPENNPDISYQKLLNSYPKASEIIETEIYKSLGRIEAAKGLNLIMLAMAFGFIFSFFLKIKGVHRFSALLCTSLLLFSPVFITQTFSFYLDAQLYFALLSLAALLGIFYLDQQNHILALIMITTGILWNLKLTGILSSGVFIITFLFINWYREKVMLFFKLVFAFFIAAVISILVLGFNPYITNVKWFGNPFFPAYGKNSTDFVKNNVPSTFYDNNRLERLFLSINSRSEMKRGPNAAHTLKMPFTYDKKEVESFAVTNNTLGGFGPLFSGAAVLIVAIVAGGIISKAHKDGRAENRIILGSLACFLVSSIAMPVSSYARYVPQLWAIGPLAMMYALSGKNYFMKTMGVSLAIILIWNVYLVAGRYYPFITQNSREVAAELEKIRSSSEHKQLKVSFGDFRSNRIRFSEAGINFVEEKTLTCQQKTRVLAKTITESLTQIC